MTVRILHECPEYMAVNPDGAGYGYGRALDGHIYVGDDGHPEMSNGEYAIRVRFCPYCGWRAATVDAVLGGSSGNRSLPSDGADKRDVTGGATDTYKHSSTGSKDT